MTYKQARNRDEAWEMQETYEGMPHGWVQWKGTDVCMDFHCSCGGSGHIDAEFAYFIRCGHCKKIYMMNGHIELIEIVELKDMSCIIDAEMDDGSL